MTYHRFLHQLEALEERLQSVKWILRIPSKEARARRTAQASIVSRTAALLGAQFPKGVLYEQQMRRVWSDRK